MRGHRARLAVAVLVATLALGACGGSSGTGSTGNGPDPAATPTTRDTAPNGVEAKSADEILRTAAEAFRGARSVRLVGRIAGGDESVDLDVRLGRDVSQGALTQKGAKLEIIATGGNLYMRGRQFWVKNAPASIASQVGDRWARLPVGGMRESLTFKELVSLDSFAERGLKPSGKISKGPRGTVEGTKAIALKDADGSLLWIAMTGPAYPLRIGSSPADGSQNSISFRDYDAPLNVEAPADSIDFNQVTG